MTYAEQEQRQGVSDEAKAERRVAITRAGSFLTAIHRAELANQMQNCPLSTTQINKVIDTIGREASDDEADPVQVIRRTLTSERLLGRHRITNSSFLNRLAPQMAKVVQDGLDERDQKIVAAGGPPRPGPGWTLSF